MQHIHHITLTTGHSRRSYRREVADNIVSLLQHDLAEALAEYGHHVAVPGVGDYTLTATAEGRCLIATVWGPPAPQIDGRRPPLATIGVAAHSRCGAQLWRLLHQIVPPTPAPATTADDCPPEPWCAVRLEIGLTLHPEAASWLGDFERCLAWAWLAMRRRSSYI